MFREHPWFGVGHGGYGIELRADQARAGRARRRVLVARALRSLRQRAQRLSRGAGGVGAVGRDRPRRRAGDPGAAAPSLRSRRRRPDRALAFAGCDRLRRARARLVSAAHRAHRLSLAAAAGVDLRRARLERATAVASAPASAGPSGARARLVGRAVPGARFRRWWSTSRSLLGRLEASRIVRTTSQVAQLAMQSGAAAARPVLQANLPAAAPRRAARSARGRRAAHHRQPLPAARQRMPRPSRATSTGSRSSRASELYFNLARALLLLGRRDQAVARAAHAVTLDPHGRRRSRGAGAARTSTARSARRRHDGEEREPRAPAPARSAAPAHTLGEVSTTLTVRSRIVQSSHRLQLAM